MIFKSSHLISIFNGNKEWNMFFGYKQFFHPIYFGFDICQMKYHSHDGSNVE